MESEPDFVINDQGENERFSVHNHHQFQQDVAFFDQKRRLRSETPNESSQLIRKRMRMNLTKFRAVFANRSFLVDTLTIFFGIGTWIGVNSLWIQLPLLVNVLPESWFLASYLVIIVQVANLGPLTYTLIQKLCPIRDSFFIYWLLTLGVAAAFVMAFFYDITAYFWGAERSIAFLGLVFCFALVGCTSSVLFMPYCGRLRDIYLVTYLIGEGLSGLLPGVLGLIQGVGGNAQCIPNEDLDDPKYVQYFPPPRFSTQTFFIIISSLFIASLIAFILLDQLKSVKKEYANVTISHGNKYEYNRNAENEEHKVNNETDRKKPEEKIKKLSVANYHGLLVLLGTICMFTNAIVPSIMPFGTLPYGNVTYHLSVTLSAIANPVACFIAVFLTGTSIRNIITLSITSLPFVIYSMTTSVMSPSPPMMDTIYGEFFVILSWTLLIGFGSYIRLKITTIFRYNDGKSLVWVGAWTQIGSFVGSVLSFIVVNYTGIFQQYNPCESL
ncbi:hypothetical protein PVAND_004085 [Polypedilum vanderplanki]|uniref:Riboflavin transporter n=1 Tax=Polypedilum vanderplanki TaxID=319348 RepID=A0A9J6BW37_POLVA|nr:hypothetical protein PVAND_004085 [Polypedilum vanderplanki]